MKNRKIKIIDSIVQKTTTNDGELCKQKYFLTQSDDGCRALIIEKTILAKSDFSKYESHGFKMVKEFKESRLYYISFSIKPDSLINALNRLSYSPQILK